MRWILEKFRNPKNTVKRAQTAIWCVDKATATFQVVSLSGSAVVVTKPKNLIFSLGGASENYE